MSSPSWTTARLDDEGFYVSHEAALDALGSQSHFNAIDPESGWKVDWIIRKDRPFSRSEFERREQVTLMDLELPMVTAEDLIVAKLEWSRIGASGVVLEEERRAEGPTPPSTPPPTGPDR